MKNAPPDICPIFGGALHNHTALFYLEFISPESEIGICGAKILIYEDGTIKGTIGGGCVESDVILKGIGFARTGQSDLLTLDLTAEASAHEGVVCGSIVKVWLEAID